MTKKMIEDAELIASTTKALSEIYRKARALAGDHNCIGHEQMKRERPVLYQAWLAVGVGSISICQDFASAWVRKFVELGPRPNSHFSEPSEITAQAEWDRKYAALVVRARAVGLLDEPVAKE